MQYKILTASTADDLTNTVSEAILSGWTPIGGVAMSVSVTYVPSERYPVGEREERTVFAQAIVIGT